MTLKKWSVLMLVGTIAVTGAGCSDDPEGPKAEVFVATMTGLQEVPSVTTTATGSAEVTFTPTGLSYTVNVANLVGLTNAHIHGPAAAGVNAGVILNLVPTPGTTTGVLAANTVTATTSTTVSMDSLKVLIRKGLTYVNVHTTANAGGHIRGQLTPK